jgi:hypothetical protein
LHRYLLRDLTAGSTEISEVSERSTVMKRLVLAIGLLASIQLTAQTIKLKATVPFDFRMGQVLMTAGEYDVIQSGPLVTMRSAEGKPTSASYLTLPASAPVSRGKGSLLFNRYGNDYFLTKVVAPDSSAGRVIPKSKQEKELMSRVRGVETASADLHRK